jgi:hypothetical protein
MLQAIFVGWARHCKAHRRADHKEHVVGNPADCRPAGYLHARPDKCNVKITP